MHVILASIAYSNVKTLCLLCLKLSKSSLNCKTRKQKNPKLDIIFHLCTSSESTAKELEKLQSTFSLYYHRINNLQH